MKATVISVFKSKEYMVHYWYHNTKKCNGDSEATYFGDAIVPMMEIRLWKEKLNSINDRRVEVNSQIVFATPEIVKRYTGFDLFESLGYYKFEGKALEIEFEWVEQQYPYLRIYHPRDYISTEKYRMLNVSKIEDIKYDW